MLDTSSHPFRMLSVYGGMAGLVYIETDGFRREAPFIFVLPILALAVMSVTLRMKPRTKYLTASSFLVKAVGLYMWAVKGRRELHYMFAIFSLSQILYLLSFIACVRRVWRALTITVILYTATIIFYCFADVFRSIPYLVTSLTIHLCIVSTCVVCAGSVWKYGSKRIDAQQAALFRFIGTVVCLGCSSMLMVGQFGNRYFSSNYALCIAHYLAQGLLFFANERAF